MCEQLELPVSSLLSPGLHECASSSCAWWCVEKSWHSSPSALKSLAFWPLVMLNVLPRSGKAKFAQLLCVFYTAFEWEPEFPMFCVQVVLWSV